MTTDGTAIRKPEITAFLRQTFHLSNQHKLIPQPLQSLWSGYGDIVRYCINADSPTADFPTTSDNKRGPNSVIVKHIAPPKQSHHPRGWSTQKSHERKLRSYDVETHWYKEWAPQLPDDIKLAHCYAQKSSDQSHCLILEDLDASGFPERYSSLSPEQTKPCLQWLAKLHGFFLQQQPSAHWHKKLWLNGSYWHFNTRPDEWQAMANGPLKDNASIIDQTLANCSYQTLIHGDAKVANFCFSTDRQSVAAVDFQYTGAGCGMKDVVYLLGSCLSETDCERSWPQLLDDYFAELKRSLARHHPAVDALQVEQQWRALFPMAWADFERFLLGWEPNHHKLTRFSHQMTQTALKTLSH